MIMHSMFQKLRGHDWSIVLVEVLLLALGLLAAFQVDRWWEQRAELQEERTYVLRLIANIEADIPHINDMLETQTLRQSYVDLLMQVASNPEHAADRPGEFLAAVVGASYTNYPTLRAHTFEELRSTGNMAVIRSVPAKEVLYSYYEMDRQQANFRTLFLSNEFRHWELATGVLSHAQAQWLQTNRIFALPSNVQFLREAKLDPEEFMATARRLAANQALIDWLPQIREMQAYFVFSMERQIKRADAVLEILRAYAVEIGANAGQTPP